MATNEPTLEDVLLEVLDSRLDAVHTALPGRVEKYNALTQTADVALQIKHVGQDEDGRLVLSSYPVLPNVPLAWPGGGGFFASFPLAPGDFVLIVFCESAIDQWRAKGTETAPGDVRRHSLTGAVAIPVIRPKTSPILGASATDLVIGMDLGSVIRITPLGQVQLADGTDPVALASLVFAAISTMLGTGVGASGTDAFAAAKTAWDALSGTLAGMGATKVSGE